MVGQHVSAAPRHSLRPVRGAPASGFRGSPEGHPSPGSFGPGDVEGPPHLREAPVPAAESKVRPPNRIFFPIFQSTLDESAFLTTRQSAFSLSCPIAAFALSPFPLCKKRKTNLQAEALPLPYYSISSELLRPPNIQRFLRISFKSYRF